MQCGRCGRKAHKFDDECPALGKICDNCDKRNHFAKVCRTKKIQKNINNGPITNLQTIQQTNIIYNTVINEPTFNCQNVPQPTNEPIIQNVQQQSASDQIIKEEKAVIGGAIIGALGFYRNFYEILILSK